MLHLPECRWPFWCGFGVTGLLITKMSLGITGAAVGLG